MKILKLDINAFGPFTGESLDFSSGNHGIHLIFGPNEAGKSSVLRAITAFLYGIPAKTPDNFLHQYGDLNIGGLLRHSSGKEQYFIRRKGNKNDLLDIDGNPVLENEMRYFLDDVSQDVFVNMYGIGSDSLVKGGRNLVEGNGEMGSTLFSAISGITEINNLLSSIEERKNSLFKPRGNTQLLNRLIKEYDDLKKLFKTASLGAKDWTELDNQIKDVNSKLEAIQQMITEKTALYHHKTRLSDASKDAGELRRLQMEIQSMEGTPLLPDDFTKRRAMAELKIKTAQDTLSVNNKELENISKKLSALDIPETILAKRDKIPALLKEAGNYEQGKGQLPKLQGEVLTLKRELNRILRELSLPEDCDTASCSLPTKDKSLINSLIDAYPDIANGLKNAEETLAQTVVDLRFQQGKIKEGEISIDVSRFENLLEEFRLAGLSEKTLEELELSLASIHQMILEDKARLGLDQLSFDAFCSLAVPTNTTISFFENAFTENDKHLNSLLEKKNTAADSLAKTNDAIKTLQVQGVIPTEKDLYAGRDNRNAMWQMIKKAWKDNQAIPDDLWKVYKSDAPDLAAAYEHTVTEADEISDRLRRESDRVASLALLLTEKERYEQTLDEMNDSYQGIQKHKTDLESRWSELLQPVCPKPLSPAEMKEWIKLYSETLHSVHEWRKTSEDLKRKAAELDSFKARFSALLSSASVAITGLSINEIYRKADELIKKEQGKNLVKQQIEERISELQQKIATQKQDLELASKNMTIWKESWIKALSAISLDSSLTPDQAKAIIEKYDALLTVIRSIEEKSSRIDALKSDHRRFEENVNSFFSYLGLPIPEGNLATAVERLNDRLVSGISDETLFNSLKKNHGDLLKANSLQENIIKTNQEELAAFMKEAQCDDLSRITECEKRSETCKEALARAEELKRIISRSAGGMNLDAFLLELECIDVDRLPQEISDLNAETLQLESDKKALYETAASLKVEQARYSGESKAADISDKMESILSQIREAAQEYTSLTLASDCMNAEIDLYRKKNQGPLLSRAGDIMKTITLEKIHGLGTYYDSDDKPILVALKNGSRLTVDQLSDGTRDQLYLALRLASLEQRMKQREPMPLITDDVLIQFDDTRAIESLKVLAKLSDQTQIIIFTHHEHLVQLAKQHLEKEILYVYKMS